MNLPGGTLGLALISYMGGWVMDDSLAIRRLRFNNRPILSSLSHPYTAPTWVFIVVQSPLNAFSKMLLDDFHQSI